MYKKCELCEQDKMLCTCKVIYEENWDVASGKAEEEKRDSAEDK